MQGRKEKHVEAPFRGAVCEDRKEVKQEWFGTEKRFLSSRQDLHVWSVADPVTLSESNFNFSLSKCWTSKFLSTSIKQVCGYWLLELEPMTTLNVDLVWSRFPDCDLGN